MSWFSDLFTGGASTLVDSIGDAGDKLFTSDEDKLKLKNQLEELKQKPHLMQAMANVTSASHRSVWVAGGRPALLWVAALGLFMFFPIRYAIGTYIWAKLSLQANELVAYPFTGNGLMELTAMLLGLAGMRTIEKIKGVTK
ncbi:hypothetical protein ACOI22_03425 [Glaciecola sp. 2405UD65-10]|uniref:hypothetical protein n=1 Tax=Glaciecola sp. 2405UD65-10 TaxID=3397244 RepID=UPI003B58CC47